MMRPLTIGDFAPLKGKSLEVEAGGGRYPLRLTEVQELPAAVREGGGFRLEFRGPPQPLLPQAIYAFHRGDERWEIFVVPIAADAEGMRYEAVFF